MTVTTWPIKLNIGLSQKSGLPWLSGKESARNAGAAEDVDSSPELGRFPGQGNGKPLQYFCLKNPLDREAL